MFLFAGLLMAVCLVATEGTLADDPSRDLSRDTSDEEKDAAVFRSIRPLESAIMPVSWTG